MARESEQKSEDANSTPTLVERKQTQAELNNEGTKGTRRHPRWTRQETIVLIEAKKVVENGGKPVCQYTSPFGCVASESKWDLISSLCQQQGVNRGPFQCRKRWSNLLSDFKKIKGWESSSMKEKVGKSFWMMRNDERRQKKLPGFFDVELYNALNGGACTIAASPLTLIKMTSKAEHGDQVEGVASEQWGEEEEEAEAIVDSEKIGWSAGEETIETNATRNEIKTPLKGSGAEETIMRGSPKVTPTHPRPSSAEKQYQPSCQENHDSGNYLDSGCQREPMSQEGCKRRQLSPDNYEDTTNFNNNIIKVLRKNSNILKAHLGAQNINYQLARDQQKEQTDSLVAALGKLTDALTKIADKL